MKIVAPELHHWMENRLSTMDDDELILLISSFTDVDSIYTAIKPMSENMTIDKIAQLYREFPFAVPGSLYVPMKDSKGNIRCVPTRRNVVDGHIYIYRLKQYAEEKFSVTSLSSTNVRNENSRNKLANSYRAPFTRTPIRFGDMETGDLMHLGPELIVQILMLYSSSPHARRLAESMMTGDPFNVDVKLDDESSNRNAEILAVYLKTKGLRLKFKKVLKEKVYPILSAAMEFYGPSKGQYSNDLPTPMYFVDPDTKRKFDEELSRKHYDLCKAAENDPMEIYPMEFYGPAILKSSFDPKKDK
jgi:hypothetical protein